MDNGLGAMNIASLNTDSTKEGEIHRDIIKNLARVKIHIEDIRETQITQGGSYLLDNYRVVAEAAAQKGKPGVIQGGPEITIHGSAQKYITQIARHSRRSIRVKLDGKNSNTPIQILTT